MKEKMKWAVAGVILALVGIIGLYIYGSLQVPPYVRQVSYFTAIRDYFLLNGHLSEEIQMKLLGQLVSPENVDEAPVESLNVIPYFNKYGHKLTLATGQAKPKSGKDIILLNRNYTSDSATWIVIIKGIDYKSRSEGYLTLLKDGSTKRIKDIDQLTKETDDIVYYIYENNAFRI